MALIDDVRIKVIAGSGGNGENVFHSFVGSPKKYPDGGDGGKGGDLYFKASNNISDLSEFRYKKKVKSGDGKKGMNNNRTGKDGEDLVVLVPPGTSVNNEETNEQIEILDNEHPVLIARGGRGGEGNHNYKPNITNYRPQFKEGEKGEVKNLHLVLRLIADIGFIGFPNAGKSSLLDVLTNAKPKIGNYAFTTLEPNLGALDKIIIADIPGLIKGASQGTGLGIKFLKHIEKTKTLMHCIDVQEKDPLSSYETVRSEFKEYSTTLLEKEEIILLTKTDLVTDDEVKAKVQALKKLNRTILTVSIYNQESIEKLKKIIEEKVGDKH